MTNNKIREEIRKMCGLTVNSDQWFKRKEMKTIAQKLSSSARVSARLRAGTKRGAKADAGAGETQRDVLQRKRAVPP